MAINNKKMSQKLQEMINISKKMNEKEFNVLVKYLDKDKFGKTNIDYLSAEYANKNYTFQTTNEIEDNKWVKLEYAKEINKLSLILNDNVIKERIGFIRVFIYGPTGTGKTTLLNLLGNLNKSYEFETVNLERYVSSKMGQTQINFLTLAEKINSEKKRKILFIDEIDSIVLDRNTQNDVAEHSRVVSTFIKFLDSLNKDIIIFAATNVEKKIDEAIVRRFNIRIQSRKMNSDIFCNLLEEEGLNLTQYKINFFKSGLTKKEFSISDFNDFKNFYILEKTLDSKTEDIYILLDYFKHDLSFDKDEISKKQMEMLKKIGINKWQ